MLSPLPVRDRELVQIVDAALAHAAQRAGKWLTCREGCTQCCVGAFKINALDAARLKHGFAELRSRDPIRAGEVRRRAQEYWSRVSQDFPGNTATGALDQTEEAEERFADFANDEPCPALDPQTGSCDLYAARPMTCRIFGPPVRTADGLGTCELCFTGATDEQILACEMTPDPDHLEDELLKGIDGSDDRRETIVAFVLAQ